MLYKAPADPGVLFINLGIVNRKIAGIFLLDINPK